MIKGLLQKSARDFGDKYDYDVDYMMKVIRTSTSAGARLSVASMMGSYRGPKKALGVWAGASYASTLDGDCKACVQLVMKMMIEEGVDEIQLRLCAEGHAVNAREVGLGFRFAQAVIAGASEREELRREICERFGEKAVIAASFAAASGRFYPVLKRGVGRGASCEPTKRRRRLFGVFSRHA